MPTDPIDLALGKCDVACVLPDVSDTEFICERLCTTDTNCDGTSTCQQASTQQPGGGDVQTAGFSICNPPPASSHTPIVSPN
jgi:hypothetical protein